MLIAGDVGGTKTDIAIYSNESGPHLPLVAGVPGKFCTSGSETSWYGRSPRWPEERSIRLSR